MIYTIENLKTELLKMEEKINLWKVDNGDKKLKTLAWDDKDFFSKSMDIEDIFAKEVGSVILDEFYISGSALSIELESAITERIIDEDVFHLQFQVNAFIDSETGTLKPFLSFVSYKEGSKHGSSHLYCENNESDIQEFFELLTKHRPKFFTYNDKVWRGRGEKKIMVTRTRAQAFELLEKAGFHDEIIKVMQSSDFFKESLNTQQGSFDDYIEYFLVEEPLDKMITHTYTNHYNQRVTETKAVEQWIDKARGCCSLSVVPVFI